MPLVHIKSKKLEFKFDLKGKYTILKGDSGIGKTSFYNLVLSMNDPLLGVLNLSKIKVIAVPQDFDLFRHEEISDCVLVIDENCSLFRKADCASFFKNSRNYFIIINRAVNYLPVHVDSLYTLQQSNRFYTLKPLFERFKDNYIKDIDCVIVEDSESGFSFIKDVFSCFDLKSNFSIETSYGASKIVSKIRENYLNGYRNFLIIYDSSAFAGYIETFMACIKVYKDCSFFVLDWESFEHYILSSSLFNIHLKLDDTGCNYESLEQYSTYKLLSVFSSYKKTLLPICFKRSRCKSCKLSGCRLRHLSYDNLIHSRLLIVYSFMNNKYTRNKVDFSYKKFYQDNKLLKENSNIISYRILSLNNQRVLLENISTQENIKLNVMELIYAVEFGRISLSNPSELKNWPGWCGV